MFWMSEAIVPEDDMTDAKSESLKYPLTDEEMDAEMWETMQAVKMIAESLQRVAEVLEADHQHRYVGGMCVNCASSGDAPSGEND